MSKEKLVEIIKKHIHHYNWDEDNWYGCPLSESGCSDDSQGEDCNCGRDKKIDDLAMAILSAGYIHRDEIEKIKDNLMYAFPTHYDNSQIITYQKGLENLAHAFSTAEGVITVKKEGKL